MKHKMINVSIVIPTKNRAERITGCLDSLIAQTYQHIEIIVVDDGSTDNTEEVVRKYRSKGVRYVRLPSGSGAQAARNYGALVSNYDWIAFQDSDDRWMPSKLSKQVAALETIDGNKNIVIHTSGLKVLESSGTVTSMVTESFEGNCYKKLLLQPGPMFQGILVNKSSLNDINGLDEACPSYQEWDTSIRLAKQCKFVHIKEPLFEWICHSGDTISKDYKREIRGRWYVMNKHRDAIVELHGSIGWQSGVADLVSRSINLGVYDYIPELLAIMPVLPRHIAQIMWKLRWHPRGSSKLLRALTLITNLRNKK